MRRFSNMCQFSVSRRQGYNRATRERLRTRGHLLELLQAKTAEPKADPMFPKNASISEALSARIAYKPSLYRLTGNRPDKNQEKP